MKAIAALNTARGLHRQPAPPAEDAAPEPPSRPPAPDVSPALFSTPFLARWLRPEPAPPGKP